MYVLATAGHVDHGKSTLVRELTGMEPDRWAEERRRGLTIDLGFAWMTLPSGERLAFVDVPGHERFVPNMLAGIGPVPAVMFVVAADEGWMPQSREHLAALDALRVRHGLLVVTRSDLADPAPVRAEALERLGRTSLRATPSVVVSGRTGAGLDDLRDELVALTGRLPAPGDAADLRLWVDRSFSVRGAGTVVTGTLQGGTLRTGDRLVVSSTGRQVQVRGLQSLGEQCDAVRAVARVAVNLRGVDRSAIGRGDALLTPGAWLPSDTVDVRLHAGSGDNPAGSGEPAVSRDAGREGGLRDGRRDGRPDVRSAARGTPVLHVGSAAVPVRVRVLGGDLARLSLAHPLPLRAGDRGLIRDPGRHEVVAGFLVLDVAPPPLNRRGAAGGRFRELAAALTTALTTARPDSPPDNRPDGVLDGRPGSGAGNRQGSGPGPDGEGWVALTALRLREQGFARAGELRAAGLPVAGRRVTPEWYADPERWSALVHRAAAEVEAWEAAHPLAAGMPEAALRQRLEVPAPALEPLAREAGLVAADGRISRPGGARGLPAPVERAVGAVEAGLREQPYQAPDANRLADLGLGARELAAAVRAGRLVEITVGVVLRPEAVERAATVLSGLPQPFTLSQAKRALDTTRRVAVPLLELLDRRGVTQRLPDGTHRLR